MPQAPKQYQPPGHKPRDDSKAADTKERCKKYRTKPWARLAWYIRQRDEFKCQKCGNDAIGKRGHVDHKIPVVQGGTDDEENLWLLCSSCHSAKTRHERG